MEPVKKDLDAAAEGRMLTGTGNTRAVEATAVPGRRVVGKTENMVMYRTCLSRRLE